MWSAVGCGGIFFPHGVLFEGLCLTFCKSRCPYFLQQKVLLIRCVSAMLHDPNRLKSLRVACQEVSDSAFG